MEEATLCERVAVTVTALNGEGAKARQISEVPSWVLVLLTSTQVSPAPEIPVTVVLGDEFLSAEIKANSSSLPEAVENAGVPIVVLAAPWSAETFASIVIAPQAGAARNKPTTSQIVIAQKCPQAVHVRKRILTFLHLL
jgi:hypothetical protein